MDYALTFLTQDLKILVKTFWEKYFEKERSLVWAAYFVPLAWKMYWIPLLGYVKCFVKCCGKNLVIYLIVTSFDESHSVE